MQTLFRGMRENANGLPVIGPSSRTLGVRPGKDVVAALATDPVRPGEGGMSVSPDDPLNLPYFRRPPALGGTGQDPVWRITEAELVPDLCYRPDQAHPGHGFVEPVRPMSLDEYQRALARTQPFWRKVV